MAKGRPKSENPRSKVIPVRYTAEEDARVTEAAVAAGRDRASFIREASLAAAERVLRKKK